MLTIDEQQRQGWLEEFNLVTALYLVLNEGRESLRTKRAEYRNDEVQAIPLDFLLDVELKARRALSETMYQMFLRLASTDSLEVLPEDAKLMLGMTWQEWGMGVEGSYKTLYFRTKNEQIRSFLKNMKGMTNGRFSANGDDDRATA